MNHLKAKSIDTRIRPLEQSEQSRIGSLKGVLATEFGMSEFSVACLMQAIADAGLKLEQR